jgi:multisubunit Na+/H+ antiporter MnhF subunit
MELLKKIALVLLAIGWVLIFLVFLAPPAIQDRLTFLMGVVILAALILYSVWYKGQYSPSGRAA